MTGSLTMWSVLIALACPVIRRPRKASVITRCSDIGLLPQRASPATWCPKPGGQRHLDPANRQVIPGLLLGQGGDRWFSAGRGLRGELYFRHGNRRRDVLTRAQSRAESRGGDDAMSPDRASEPTRHGLPARCRPGPAPAPGAGRAGPGGGRPARCGWAGRQCLHAADRAGRHRHRRRLDRRRRSGTVACGPDDRGRGPGRLAGARSTPTCTWRAPS